MSRKAKIVDRRNRTAARPVQFGDPAQPSDSLSKVIKAGVPVEVAYAAMMQVRSSLVWYSVTLASRAQIPSVTEERKELEKIYRSSEALIERLYHLAPQTRVKLELFKHGAGYNDGIKEGTSVLERHLQSLSRTLENIPLRSRIQPAERSKGSKETELGLFCASMAAIWKKHVPGVKGTKRSGSAKGSARSEYSGPLFEFCRDVMQSEVPKLIDQKGRPTSRTLGEELFKAEKSDRRSPQVISALMQAWRPPC